MPNAAALRDTWRSLEPRGQLTLVGSALIVVVTMVFLYTWASKPTYTPLESGLDPSEAAKVSEALDGAGVGYRIENGGTQVSVREGQESAARIALAEGGVDTGGHVGLELFDKSKLGTTDFENQVKYQRALEGEIARTLESIDGVSAARVQLVLPRESLFAEDASQASASVMLTGGSTLDGANVKAAAHLVKSAVEGLDAENVTITDEGANLLWPSGDEGSLSAATQLTQEQRYDARLSAQVDSRLLQVLGPNKAYSQVHADLNLDESTVDEVKYGKTPVALSEDTEQETLAGGAGANAGAGGASGTAANVPPYAAGTQAGGDGQDYNRKSSSVVNGVDKTVTHTAVAPGEVEKLSVGLIVDKTVPAADVQALEDSVAAMVGLDPARGDTISVTQIQFPAPEEIEAATADPAAGPLGLGSPIDMAKYGAVALALAVFLFLMRRNLRRREGEELAQQPTWLREIEQTMPIAQLEPATPERRLDPDAARASAVQQEAAELVRDRPEHLAAQVQEWMNEGQR